MNYPCLDGDGWIMFVFVVLCYYKALDDTIGVFTGNSTNSASLVTMTAIIYCGIWSLLHTIHYLDDFQLYVCDYTLLWCLQ